MNQSKPSPPPRSIATISAERRNLFQHVLADCYADLAPALQNRFALPPDDPDHKQPDHELVMRGLLDVRAAWPIRLMARLFGTLVPASGTDIPVTVRFRAQNCQHATGTTQRLFHFDRLFAFPGRPPHRFHSIMRGLPDGTVVEHIKFGLGWHVAIHCRADGGISFDHRGYIWQLFGHDIPVPLDWLLGRGFAVEQPADSPARFTMSAWLKHRWFGTLFHYEGWFEPK